MALTISLSVVPTGAKTRVVGFFARIVNTTADQQKVLPVIFPLLQHGHHRPIKEPGPFGALAHGDPLPILGVKRECFGLSHRHAFAALAGLYPHGFIAGYCQPVEVLVRFQPGTQLPITAVDRYPQRPRQKGSWLATNAQSSAGPVRIWSESAPPRESLLLDSVPDQEASAKGDRVRGPPVCGLWS